MDKITIEKIIENLTRYEYKFYSETTENEAIRFSFNKGQILFNFKNEVLDLCIVRFQYKLPITEDEVIFLNELNRSPFYFYKHWLDFVYKPNDEKELENTMKFFLDNYN